MNDRLTLVYSLKMLSLFKRLLFTLLMFGRYKFRIPRPSQRVWETKQAMAHFRGNNHYFRCTFLQEATILHRTSSLHGNVLFVVRWTYGSFKWRTILVCLATMTKCQKYKQQKRNRLNISPARNGWSWICFDSQAHNFMMGTIDERFSTQSVYIKTSQWVVS